MKKYEFTDYQMIIENTFSKHLENRAKEGWIFLRIKREIIEFIKEEPQDIKYQIEFYETDYDYDDYLKENGYTYVDHMKRMVIYKNNNIHAPDLHTDDHVRLRITKNMISKHPIIIFLSIMLLCLPLILILSLIPHIFTSFGALLKMIEFIPVLLFILCLFFALLFNTIQSLLIKKICQNIIDHKEISYRGLHIVNKGLRLLSVIELCLIPFALIRFIWLLNVDFVPIIIRLLFIVMIGLIIYFIDQLLRKYRIEKKIILFVYAVIILIASLSSQTFFDPLKKEETIIPQIKSYMKEEALYEEDNHLLFDSYTYSYNPDQLWNPIKYERVEICLNEWIAREIMKDDIIQLEKETRASNEFIEAYIDEHGYYSSTDIKHKSYKEAIKSINVYKHDYVDECYYNEHFLIIRKENSIVIHYMQEDYNIDHVIEYYFNNIKNK